MVLYMFLQLLLFSGEPERTILRVRFTAFGTLKKVFNMVLYFEIRQICTFDLRKIVNDYKKYKVYFELSITNVVADLFAI